MKEPNGKQIEIDESSGFCFGVTTAIKKAEEELAKGDTLYCLGDIVHNGQECERLKQLGLITINHEKFARLNHVKVLLRAHGEPPQTYRQAQENRIEIIDAKRSKSSFSEKTDMPKSWGWWDRPTGKPSLSKTWKKPNNWTSTSISACIRKPPSRLTNSGR